MPDNTYRPGTMNIGRKDRAPVYDAGSSIKTSAEPKGGRAVDDRRAAACAERRGLS